MRIILMLALGLIFGLLASTLTLLLGCSILVLFPMLGDSETVYLIGQIEMAAMIVGIMMCGVTFINGVDHDDTRNTKS